MTLEEIVKKYMFKTVEIKLDSSAVFKGYLVGIKLPVKETVMLYFVNEKHGDKYIKHYSSRWVEQLPFEMIEGVKIINGNLEIEATLYNKALNEQLV